ncbi:MAG: transcription antitermination factor NusB [Selenomonadaceae bacterium]|jgi:transcription antitermination factor NusB
MSRRQAREVALQALFQLDFNEVTIEAAVDAALGESAVLADRDREYLRKAVSGTKENLAAIDAIIMECSREWKVERMSGIDRNIARLAVFEMKFNEEEITPNIVINEAVELAKKYGTDESARFINGVLGAMVK